MNLLLRPDSGSSLSFSLSFVSARLRSSSRLGLTVLANRQYSQQWLWAVLPSAPLRIQGYWTLVTIESQPALALLRGSVAEFRAFSGFDNTIRKQYEAFVIHKRSGGVRKIHVPAAGLANVQSRIGACLAAAATPHRSSHGFLNGRSIVTNALNHFGANAMLNFDVDGFFDAIVDDDLITALVTSPLRIAPPLARWISEVCCLRGSLPTGSPSSPILSDIFMRDVDARYSRIANDAGCQYSRYGDDFTFSTSSATFPTDLAFALKRPLRGVVLSPTITHVLSRHQLRINAKKTRIDRSGSGRLVVTGIQLGPRLDVRERLVKRVEAMLRLVETRGLSVCEQHHRANSRPGTFHGKLASTIAFISQVRGSGEPTVQAWRHRLYGTPVLEETMFWRQKLTQNRGGSVDLRMRPTPARPGEIVFVLSSTGENVISTRLLLKESKIMIDTSLPASGACIDHRGAIIGHVN